MCPTYSCRERERGTRHGRVNHLTSAPGHSQQICYFRFTVCSLLLKLLPTTTTRLCGGICHASPIFARFSILPRFIISIILLFLFGSDETQSAVFDFWRFLSLSQHVFFVPFFLLLKWISLSGDSRSKGGRKRRNKMSGAHFAMCNVKTKKRLTACMCVWHLKRKNHGFLYNTHLYINTMISWFYWFTSTCNC